MKPRALFRGAFSTDWVWHSLPDSNVAFLVNIDADAVLGRVWRLNAVPRKRRDGASTLLARFWKFTMVPGTWRGVCMGDGLQEAPGRRFYFAGAVLEKFGRVVDLEEVEGGEKIDCRWGVGMVVIAKLVKL